MYTFIIGALTFSKWWVIIPLFIAQYALALFSLTRLAYCNISIKKYVMWNLLCLLVFFIGSTVFLIYYYTHKTQLTKKEEHRQDSIVIDAPIIDGQAVSAKENAVNKETPEKTDVSEKVD